MAEEFATMRWSSGIDGHLVLLYQTRLPAETVYLGTAQWTSMGCAQRNPPIAPARHRR
jgi:hypothetical protein